MPFSLKYRKTSLRRCSNKAVLFSIFNIFWTGFDVDEDVHIGVYRQTGFFLILAKNLRSRLSMMR